MFKKAEKKNLLLKIALVGKSGTGKTYSALTIAKGLGDKVCLIDTENSACCVYADQFDFDYKLIDPPYTCDKYIKAIAEAEQIGYEVIIIDSFSSAWDGEGGILEMVSELEANSSKNINHWRTAKADYRPLKNAIFNSKVPIIATMLSKPNVITKEQNDPIAEPNIERDFTIMFVLEEEGRAIAKKNRTELFKSGSFLLTVESGQKLKKWVDDTFEVSEKEIKYVRDLLGQSGWSNDQFKEYLQKEFNLTFKQLNRDQYESCIWFLKNQSEIKKVVEKELEVPNDK